MLNVRLRSNIFRTPHSISQSKKNLFELSVISIGPFHHGPKHLRAMEEHKGSSCRISCETFDDLDSNAFVEMMLIDGCFVLEFFLKWMQQNWKSIIEVGWNCQFIKHDLLLQENQIPFVIVEKLLELIGFDQDATLMIFLKCIATYLLPGDFIFRDPPAETPDTPAEIPNPPAEIPNPLNKLPDPPTEIHHLVHLCCHYLVPNPGIPVVLSSKPFDLTRMFRANRIIKGLLHRFGSRLMWRGRSPHSTSGSSSVSLPNSTRGISSMIIPCATELKQKGLKFTPQSNLEHMLDISFVYGVLKIPRLKITDSIKSIAANLMAFEHSKYGKENKPFTSFVIFLDNLVNTPNDVTILQECEIVNNWLGSEEALTHFFNHVILENGHYLVQLCKEVNKYSKNSWNRQRAKLFRDYFSSPWATISLIAAFILLILTFVQSFFAVFAYFCPPSP